MSLNLSGLVSAIGGAFGVSSGVTDIASALGSAFAPDYFGASVTAPTIAAAPPLSIATPGILAPPASTGAGGAPTAPDGSPLGLYIDPFFGRHVQVDPAQWSRFERLPEMPADIITASQADDRNIAKLAIKHAVIPAESDLGLALQQGGAKVTTRRVRMSDGTVQTMRVIATSGRKRRAYTATPRRMRAAARTMRAMGATVKTYKKLASAGAKIHNTLSPKRGGACKAVTKTTCRKR